MLLTLGIRPRIILPSAALSIDMITNEPKAPKNTVIRACRVAMIAAIRKVLSPEEVYMIISVLPWRSGTISPHAPISDTTIMMNACQKASEGRSALERLAATKVPIYLERITHSDCPHLPSSRP